MKLIYIALFFALVCSLPGLPAQTYYSQGTGNWETLSNWNTDPGGAGTAPGSIPDDPAINIVVQSGHTVTINSVGNYDVHNLTVDGTLLSSTSSSTNRYINVYGTDLNVDGTLGGPDNGMSIDVNGPSCLFSGNGTVQLSRLRKDHDDAGVSLVTNLTIDIDITLSWASTAAFYYNGIGTTAKSFNVTINTGKTVTVTSSDVSIDGIDGTNSSWADGTFTINGTLDVGRDLYATTDNPSGGNINYVIGPTGTIVVRRQLVGNQGAGPSLAALTVQNGGLLQVTGSISAVVFASLSVSLNTFSFLTGSTVDYAGASTQIVEESFSYHNITISGGGQKNLEGNTSANGTLDLVNGILLCSTFNMTVNPGGATAGGSSASYVRTNNTGAFFQTAEATPVNYPVGNSTYNPAILTNAGASDIFSVRVTDDVLLNGTTGAAFPTGVVDRSWFVEETVAGGSDLTLELTWNTSQELSGFSRSSCYVSRHTGAGWNGDAPGAASGSNPYTRSRSGFTALSPFAVGSGTNLPVELRDFQARAIQRQALLQWSTASETNNHYFAVERSADGVGYEEIGRLSGAGTSRTIRNYDFWDNAPLTGANYYRLRQVDYDGQPAFSAVRRVEFHLNTPFRVFPSPAFVQIQLAWTASPPATDMDWGIYDTAGRCQRQGKCPAGSPGLEIPVHQLPPGIYLLRLTGDRQVWFHTFVKQ